MSLNHPQLMRYYDGELSTEEAAEVEAALEHDQEAQRVFEGLEQLSVFVRLHDREQAPSADGLTDAIMARISREEPGGKTESVAPQVVRGPWRNIVPAAAAVLALAASVALVNELSKKTETTTRPVVEQPTAPSEQPLAPVPPVEEPAGEQVLAESDPAVSIETVDFGAREGTIFLMQEGEGSTPVVWLMDEPAPAGGRMEPL